jgi:hypothetical protein
VVTNYARRNGIEDGLGTNVNFFHRDCLSSEVRLNVDLDVTLTVIANGCYRWLAGRLKEFERAKPKQLYRKFVETGGQIEVAPNRQLQVTFDRRCHNPILREAALDGAAASPPSGEAALDGAAASHPSGEAALDGAAASPPSGEAALDAEARPIPWLKNYRVAFDHL